MIGVRRLMASAAAGLVACGAALAGAVATHAAVPACTSATLAPLTAQRLDTNITLQASSAGCDLPQYEYFVQPPGGSWGAVTGWTGTPFVWHPGHGAATGIYGIGVWAREVGSSATYEAYYLGTVTVKSDACDAVELTATTQYSPPWSLQATAHNCINPNYEWWALPPGGKWTLVGGWQTANTFTYDPPTHSGNWQLGVWVREGGTGSGYEAYALTMGYTSGCPWAIATTMQDLAVAGYTVSISAATYTGCAAPVAPLYEFWARSPSGTWSVQQPYSPTAWWNWSTADLAPGTYQYGLWVKQSTSGAAYDDYGIGTVTLLSGACTGAAIDNGNLPSPQPWRVTVSFNASFDTTQPSGCGGPLTLFRFWQYRPDTATWKIVQDWSQSSTFAWDTTGLPAGPIRIGVWIKERANTPFGPAYDTYAITTFWDSGG